jgi:hypothetical protein
MLKNMQTSITVLLPGKDNVTFTQREILDPLYSFGQITRTLEGDSHSNIKRRRMRMPCFSWVNEQLEADSL